MFLLFVYCLYCCWPKYGCKMLNKDIMGVGGGIGDLIPESRNYFKKNPVIPDLKLKKSRIPLKSRLFSETVSVNAVRMRIDCRKVKIKISKMLSDLNLLRNTGWNLINLLLIHKFYVLIAKMDGFYKVLYINPGSRYWKSRNSELKYLISPRPDIIFSRNSELKFSKSQIPELKNGQSRRPEKGPAPPLYNVPNMNKIHHKINDSWKSGKWNKSYWTEQMWIVDGRWRTTTDMTEDYTLIT